MPSLEALLADHAPLLLLDAAGTSVQAGWLESGEPPRWVRLDEEAGSGVFRALELLAAEVDRANAFVFCEGPGSILGIRTTAVALRTWQVLRPRPVFAYRSLDLLASAGGETGLTVIADARRQTWHAVTVDEHGRPGALVRVPPEQLRPPLAMPTGFRHWSPLPTAEVRSLPYDLPDLWSRCAGRELLRLTPEPDAFLHEEPSYVTWTPKVHQADLQGNDPVKGAR